MIAASTQFRENLEKNGRTFHARFLNSYYPEGDDLLLTNEQGKVIKTKEGKVLICKNRDHRTVIPGDVRSVLVHKGSCGAEQFCIGALYAPYVECVIDNCTIPLENRELILQIGIMVNDDISNPEFDYINIGYFTVSKPASSSRRCTFTAYGRLSSRCGGLYESALSYPATLSSVMNEVAEQTGLNIRASGLDLSGELQKDLTGMRHYEVLMTIASLAGGFVTEDAEGGIVLSSYPQSVIAREVTPDVITADPVFYDNTYSLNGIKCIVSPAGNGEEGSEVEEQSFTWQSGRYQYQNAYMTQELFDIMVKNAGGYSYHPGNLPVASGDPRLEAWDVVRYTDIYGRSYDVPCMDLVITYDGGISCTLTAPGETDTENDANFAGALTRQIEQISSDVISAREGAQKAWDYADSANDAAKEAWNHADEAFAASTEAERAAQAAEGSASTAAAAATAAEGSASQAAAAATNAEGSSNQAAQAARNAEIRAGTAAEAATQAQKSAEEAGEAAQKASEDASAAHVAAAGAQTAATEAEKSASEANKYATGALNQLSIVEDVVGVLNWVTEHATYKASVDTEVAPGKHYFLRTGSGTSADPYVYSLVASPSGNPSSQNYYEIESIDEAVGNYVTSHLALTNEGLWVTNDSSSYKILLASDGMKVYDSHGILVATFGESIAFSSIRKQYIGGEEAYIVFDPSDGTLRIGGNRVIIGSGKKLSDVLTNLYIQTTYGTNTITYTAHLYVSGVDIAQSEAGRLDWFYRKKSGLEYIASGYQITVNKEDYMQVVGVQWTKTDDLVLKNKVGKVIIDKNGKRILAKTEVD